MSVKSVTFETSYQVAEGDVHLTVGIGDGQFGTSLVTLPDGSLIGPGEIEDEPLGGGSELEGGQVRIKTIVTDVNDMTNFTSVTYGLRGGPTPLDATVTASVDEEGGSVVYRTTISFV